MNQLIKKSILSFVFSLLVFSVYSQTANVKEDSLSKDYQELKLKIKQLFANAQPGGFGEFEPGVKEDLVTGKKVIAFTFDACGGPGRTGYDEELINYLRKEKVKATLFVTGLWIEANPEKFLELSKDPLFEMENHGLYHRPCSVDGEEKYHVEGTMNIGQAVDEMELNARKIAKLTGRRPIFYRSATAYADEECTKIAKLLNITLVSYDILSGDAVAFTPANEISKNVLSKAKHGATVIMHMNHPEWYGYEALTTIIPELKKRGYSFAKLNEYTLKSKN